MSGPTLSSALAVPFAWTSAGAGLDISISFASGTSPVGVTVATGTYRMVLAPVATDFVRVVAAAINTAMTGAGRTEVFTASVGADGLVTLSATGAFTISVVPLALVALGFTVGALTNVITSTATVSPHHLALFVERVSADWTQRTKVAGAETLAGVGYGVQVGTYYAEDELAFGFVPRDPTQRASLGVDQTAWYPAAGVTWGDHAGEWSVTDVLAVALGKTCAAALGTFQTLRTSTTETYDLVTIPAVEIASPRKTRLREGWDAYFSWTVRLIRQSTATGTRA